MDVLALTAFLVIGVLAGLIGGLLGLSGGVITVPCLIMTLHFIDYPQTYLVHTAMGTSLAAMVLNGIASTWAHHGRGGVLWSIVLRMFPGIIVGSLLGAFVANFLSGVILALLFGLFLSLLGVYLLLKKGVHKEKKPPEHPLYAWLGLGVGTAASLLGIGGGVFTVPLLLAYRYKEKEAVGTSAAIGLCITFLAAIGYLYLGMGKVKSEYVFGYIYLPAFILVGLGAAAFAPWGAKLAHRMKGTLLRKVFAVTLIIVGVLMIFN